MAITEVGAGTQRSTGTGEDAPTADVIFNDDVTAGSLIVVTAATWNAELASSMTFSKKAGSTATIGAFSTIFGPLGVAWAGGFATGAIGYARVTGSGSLTVTATSDLVSGNYYNLAADEFAGSGLALDVDGAELTFGPAATSVTDSITTLTDGALIIGLMVIDGSVGAISEGSGYTAVAKDTTTAIQPYSAMFKVAGAAGAYDVGWSWVVTNNAGSVVNAAFKEVPTAFELDADAGSYAIAGSTAGLDATLNSTYTLDADAGEYAVTGAVVVLGHSVPSDFGEYAITGADATLRHGYSMAADAAPYSYVGGAATLQFNGAPQAPAPLGSGAAKKIMPPWFRR